MATKNENLCEEIEREIGWLRYHFVTAGGDGAGQRRACCALCQAEYFFPADNPIVRERVKHKPDCLVARLRAALKTRFMLHVSSEKRLTFTPGAQYREADRFHRVNKFLTGLYEAAEELGLEIEGTITHG